MEEPDSLLTLRADCPLSLVDICMRMMAKKPENRPQTAGEVAQMLADWLSDRGEESGLAPSPGSGSGGGHASGSGVGSGILSRYSSSTPFPSSTGSTPTGASETGKLNASSSVDTDEDIGLAPLDDDAEDKPAKKKSKPKSKVKKSPSPSSGVLSDESGEKLSGSKVSKGSLSSPSSKPKSIFEEEYAESGEVDPIARRAERVSEYDPLHPPGYKNPYNKTPWWVWAGVGLAVVVVIFAIVINL